MVGLLLIERNDKVAQTICRLLERLIGLQERDRRRHFAAKHRCRMLAQRIQKNRQSQRRRQLIHRRIFTHRHQNICHILDVLDNLLFC